MMNSDKFNISDETFSKLAGKSGLIYLTELKGIINLNSVTSILEKELSENSGDRRKLHDGTYAVRKYGHWVDDKNPDIKIDMAHYPELAKDIDYKLLK